MDITDIKRGMRVSFRVMSRRDAPARAGTVTGFRRSGKGQWVQVQTDDGTYYMTRAALITAA